MSHEIQQKLNDLYLKKGLIELEISEVKSQCKHEEVIEKQEDHEGGYDYTASTTYSKYCKFCGTTLEFKVVQYPGRYS